MVIFTGGKSTRIDSPRHLTLRHARRTVSQFKLARGLILAEDADDGPDLNPGEERLNSFWAPGLEAGPKHRIAVSQSVRDPKSGKTLDLSSQQDFYVDAPQFSLPENSVYSFYPPAGYADDCRILPHVVLSDPHLPWERLGSPIHHGKKDDRNKVPWLALFTFTQDELKLQPGALGSIDVKTQTPTQTLKMKVSELQAIPNVAMPYTDDLGEDIGDEVGQFIFLKPDLFKSLFSTFDDDGKRQTGDKPDTTQYKFLSHVRKINTTGMAVAGEEDIGIFSIVVGNRCGPLDITTATSVSVHLVSMEGVEAMDWPGQGKDYVGLCSLHSWNYTVQPPGMLNVHHAFRHLGDTLELLRPPEEMIKPLRSGDKMAQRLAARLQDGYSLVKWRVQTGEETVALFRGPFTPTTVIPDQPALNKCSNSSQDLQILDQKLGIMDISYAAAWQVGRTIALGNQTFAAALVRLRTAIHQKAMRELKIKAVRDAGSDESFRRRTDVLKDLAETVASLHEIHSAPSVSDGNSNFAPGAPAQRWHRQRLKPKEYPKFSFAAPIIKDDYLDEAKKAAEELAKATDGTIYNETNVPVSTDWMVVLAFVMDRMSLDGVPAHYLVTDPSHLEPESLKFFYIDHNWVDAMVDGALSLANHMGEDRDRAAIKHALNLFIKAKPEDQPHAPQIPTYGFYLRSDLVSMFPDLRVSTYPEPPKGTHPERAPLLRHTIVADGVMLTLLDRVPGSKDFKRLMFRQPSHQQRFAVGSELSAEQLEVDIGRQYTVEQSIRGQDPLRHETLKEITMGPKDKNNWLVWSTEPGSDTHDLRILRLPYFADQQLAILTDPKDGMPKEYFDDDASTSALLAMQLNDPIWRLVIRMVGDNDGDEPTTGGSARLLPHAMALASLHAQQPEGPRLFRSLIPPEIKRPEVHDEDAHAVEVINLEPDQIHRRFRHQDGGSYFRRHNLYRPPPHVFRPHLAPHVRALVSETLHEGMKCDQPHGVPIDYLENLRPMHWHDTPSTGSRHMTSFAAARHGTSFAVSEAPAAPDDGDGDAANRPKFKCAIYSLATGRNTWDSVIQDKNHLPQDLIFSIQLSNTKGSDYELREFDIAIPLGPVNARDSTFMMETYDGPGATMLSNLRFNVLTSFTELKSGIQCLLLRVIPRSSTGWISVQNVKDISFLLCLAKVNQFKDDELVTIPTSAYYTYKPETPREDKFTVPLLVNG